MSYAGMHMKLFRQKGSASKGECVDCGGSAMHWSHVRGCADEQICPQKGLVYCTHPDHYVNRCASCHKKYDGSWDLNPYAAGKITEDEVRAIRGLVAGGAPRREVAAAFGVSRTTVTQTVNRKVWAHIH